MNNFLESDAKGLSMGRVADSNACDVVDVLC